MTAQKHFNKWVPEPTDSIEVAAIKMACFQMELHNTVAYKWLLEIVESAPRRGHKQAMERCLYVAQGARDALWEAKRLCWRYGAYK